MQIYVGIWCVWENLFQENCKILKLKKNFTNFLAKHLYQKGGGGSTKYGFIKGADIRCKKPD